MIDTPQEDQAEESQSKDQAVWETADESAQDVGTAGSAPEGEIIDASARTRPRIHDVDAEPEKVGDLEFLGDVPLKLSMVLGESDMTLGEVIALEADSVVQLGKPSGEPIDIYVENQMLGKGEVIVLHDKVRVRVLEITRPSREKAGQETRRPEEDA